VADLEPPSNSPHRFTIASRDAPAGALICTAASMPWLGSSRTVTAAIPSSRSGAIAASKARCAASRRNGCL
jgi:hypothetical protein